MSETPKPLLPTEEEVQVTSTKEHREKRDKKEHKKDKKKKKRHHKDHGDGEDDVDLKLYEGLDIKKLQKDIELLQQGQMPSTYSVLDGGATPAPDN